ncbi:MAG TPA: flagellar assembly protein FliW [Solirubrobacteraceae bacterium]|jgi:flagellar assembly factor FliW|nr:flagellar assembly protein FliW [Solirubrobacteraceae bacterium]
MRGGGALSVTITGTRFGDIEVAAEQVLDMPNGLVGIPGRRYALVGDADAPFRWLQSLDDPSFALPVTDPGRHDIEFSLDLGEDVPASELAACQVLVTVRAAERLEDFTVNLRAPIVVHEGSAWQVINQAEGAPLREPLFHGAPTPTSAAAAA